MGGGGKALKSLEENKRKLLPFFILFYIMRLFLFSLHVNPHVSSLPLCCIPKVAAGRGLVPKGSGAEWASGPRRSAAADVHPHRFRSKNPKLMFH